jgi:hypothetical protein
MSKRYQDPSETFASHKPRKGQTVTYEGRSGIVQKVEGTLCWVLYDGMPESTFIWCFHDGLNKLHDWPTKAGQS